MRHPGLDPGEVPWRLIIVVSPEICVPGILRLNGGSKGSEAEAIVADCLFGIECI
jgi:hypothetical protein